MRGRGGQTGGAHPCPRPRPPGDFGGPRTSGRRRLRKSDRDGTAHPTADAQPTSASSVALKTAASLGTRLFLKWVLALRWQIALCAQ